MDAIPQILEPFHKNRNCSTLCRSSWILPIFFVVFINDLPSFQGTNIAFRYAHDTKIWRPIYADIDHVILQKDIDNMND